MKKYFFILIIMLLFISSCKTLNIKTSEMEIDYFSYGESNINEISFIKNKNGFSANIKKSIMKSPDIIEVIELIKGKL